jgi:hypothetical protein
MRTKKRAIRERGRRGTDNGQTAAGQKWFSKNAKAWQVHGHDMGKYDPLAESFFADSAPIFFYPAPDQRKKTNTITSPGSLSPYFLRSVVYAKKTRGMGCVFGWRIDNLFWWTRRVRLDGVRAMNKWESISLGVYLKTPWQGAKVRSIKTVLKSSRNLSSPYLMILYDHVQRRRERERESVCVCVCWC